MVRPRQRTKAMKPASRAVKLLTLVFLVTAIVAAACGRADKGRNDSASAAGRARAAARDAYPQPRLPAYFKPPESVDDPMGAARSVVRKPSCPQGEGNGILQPRESVLI